ncbi:MAG: response regulator [Candidatus Paceibacterota bacterium]
MAQKILIIEDDKFLRQLVSRKLSKQDFEIAEAVDGESGLEKVKEVNPDLVLLDLILPGMDGFEVLSEIKDDPETSSVPVVILSNLGQKDEIEKGLQMGAEDYLVKAHFTLGEIVEKIKKVT